tara:strand:+ start:297 stop:695 length:399 start_codon:yes stop_codon:yes gene_type:complete
LIVKRIILILIGLSFLQACGPDAPPKSEAIPDWVIPEDKMVKILTDVHIIEGARIGTKVLGDSLSAKDHYEMLWHKYQISPEVYDSSFRFYSRNAERMDLMYEEVLTNLTKLSSEVQANGSDEENEEAEEDS